MNWLWKSIGYWFLLITCLVVGVLFTGCFMLLWAFQGNWAFSLENIVGMTFGAIFLAMFFIYYKDRQLFPLKKPPQKSLLLFSAGNNRGYPKTIELKNNLEGYPVEHSCGALSPIRFRAVQINPNSDTHEKDYEKIFHNSKTNEVVDYDASKQDHRQLYEHFLWMISRPKSFARPYLAQHKITSTEPDRGESANTIH